MMKNATPQEREFAAKVLECVDDINLVLETLCERYDDDLIVVAALAEHVGGALAIFLHNGVCSPDQARRVVQHIEDTAFARGDDS